MENYSTQEIIYLNMKEKFPLKLTIHYISYYYEGLSLYNLCFLPNIGNSDIQT